jgi:hypothetical protein
VLLDDADLDGLKARKLTSLSIEQLITLSGVEKAEVFRVLTKEDSPKFAKLPKNLMVTFRQLNCNRFLNIILIIF